MMEYILLENKVEKSDDKKLGKAYSRFELLLTALKKKEIPDKIVGTVNDYIVSINSHSGSSAELRKLLKSSREKILSLIEKELKLVPKGHYMSRWMVIGMTAIGIPIGIAIGASSGNVGTYLAVGIAVGMSMGIAIGAAKDKEALEADLQLDLSA